MFRARTNGDAIKVTVQSRRFYTLRRLSQRSSTPLKYLVTVRIKLRRERGVELPGARVRQVRQGRAPSTRESPYTMDTATQPRAPSTRESPYMMDTATQPRIKVAACMIRDAAYHQDDVASSSYRTNRRRPRVTVMVTVAQTFPPILFLS